MKKIMILLLIIAIVAILSMFMITTAGLLSVENAIDSAEVNTVLQPRCKAGVTYVRWVGRGGVHYHAW